MRNHEEFRRHLDHVLTLAPEATAIYVRDISYSWEQLAGSIDSIDNTLAGVT